MGDLDPRINSNWKVSVSRGSSELNVNSESQASKQGASEVRVDPDPHDGGKMRRRVTVTGVGCLWKGNPSQFVS
jgi:hypothetical protein